MELLNIFKYILHDTQLNSIDIEKGTNAIRLYFDNGVYFLKENASTSTLIDKKCILRILTDAEDKQSAICKFWIVAPSRTKHRYLDLKNLVKILKNNKVEISNVYISYFNNNVLLLAGYEKDSFEIEICDCVKIDYIFDDE